MARIWTCTIAPASEASAASDSREVAPGDAGRRRRARHRREPLRQVAADGRAKRSGSTRTRARSTCCSSLVLPGLLPEAGALGEAESESATTVAGRRS